jgi:hypothetical protein
MLGKDRHSSSFDRCLNGVKSFITAVECKEVNGNENEKIQGSLQNAGIFVDFGEENGFAHVIEDEKEFPRNFAQGNNE